MIKIKKMFAPTPPRFTFPSTDSDSLNVQCNDSNICACVHYSVWKFVGIAVSIFRPVELAQTCAYFNFGRFNFNHDDGHSTRRFLCKGQ